MKKEPLIFLKHILKEVNKIEESTKDLSKEGFKKDVNIQDATIRRIEIIGEAAKNLPKSFKDKHKNKKIPWIDITDTRNKLIHHYFGVDLDITWEIAKVHVPDLKKKIKAIVEEESKEK